MFFSGIADEAGEPIDVQIKAQKELGWRHIEIRNVNGINLTDLCDEAFDQVAGKVEEAGLQVSCFASQLCNWARPITKHPDIDRHELERAIPRMKRMNCEFIRTMSYPNGGWPEDEWRDEAIARVKTLARIAEQGGTVLVHENCDGWGAVSSGNMLALLAEVDSPSLKIVWDTGNSIPHGLDPWAFYEAVREHVVYVHIKDDRMVDGKTVYTYPGEGDGKVREVITDLLKRGYEGGFSIEPHLAAIVHEGKSAGQAESPYELYVEHGRRLMKLMQELTA